MIYAPFYNNSIYHVVDEKLENIADCSINEVKTIMQKLNPNKSDGPDRIATLHSKNTVCFALAPSVTYILKKSFSTGLLPEDWKFADVTLYIKKWFEMFT